MNELNLRNDEVILYQEDLISYTYNNRYIGNRELYLTNYNLILVERSLFKRQIKNCIKHNLNDINIINDVPHVQIKSSDQEDLTISFNKNMITLGFDSRREAKQWQNHILSLVTGEKMNFDAQIPTEILGSEELANALYDTVDLFKGVFNKKDTVVKQQPKAKTGFVLKNCKGCSAPISGKEGQLVKCEYCDTQQQL